jgi:hypothetical protein
VKAKQKNTFRKNLQTQLRRHMKLAFVPHHANQYRPHLIRRYGIAALLVVIIGVQVGYNYSTTGTVLGDKAAISTDTLLTDTNAERVKNKLPPLALDGKLSQAAFLKAKDMLAHQYWAHTAPNGATPWQWFSEAGYNYSYAGENLAKNFHSADAVTAAWIASPEHEANIVDEHYTQVGFAVVDGVLSGKETTLVVALYGTPADATLPVAAISNETNNAATARNSESIATRFGLALRALTPAAIAAIVIALAAGAVALTAHIYRRKLPKALRQSWYRHHGIIKASGMVSLCFIIVFLYSGGQI